MTCAECTDARTDPTRDFYTGQCISCQARALAVTGDRAALSIDPLEPEAAATMFRLFGEKWPDHLPAVRWWIRRIRQVEAQA